MKKRDKKMILHRETLRQLNEREASHAAGQAAQQLGIITSCIEPNCCGNETLGTQ